jgi:hypothetical protein
VRKLVIPSQPNSSNPRTIDLAPEAHTYSSMLLSARISHMGTHLKMDMSPEKRTISIMAGTISKTFPSTPPCL